MSCVLICIHSESKTCSKPKFVICVAIDLLYTIEYIKILSFLLIQNYSIFSKLFSFYSPLKYLYIYKSPSSFILVCSRVIQGLEENVYQMSMIRLCTVSTHILSRS